MILKPLYRDRALGGKDVIGRTSCYKINYYSALKGIPLLQNPTVHHLQIESTHVQMNEQKIIEDRMLIVNRRDLARWSVQSC